MNTPTLNQAILITIAYFDAFDYPMTYFEIWKWLYRKQTDLASVITATDELVASGVIEHKNGCFFLPHPGSDLFLTRQEQYLKSEDLWEKALLMSKIISCIPHIRMIAIVNSLAFFNSDSQSDIDFLIVARAGRIWTVRALTGTLLFVLGLKRHGRKSAGRACLSFYIADDKLDLSSIAQDRYGLFVAYWVAQTAPIWDRDRLFEHYSTANAWTRDYLPNSIPAVTNYYYDFRIPLISRVIKTILTPFLTPRFIESAARAIQRKKIDRSQRKWGHPESVITTDHMLKFHPVDHRPHYLDEIKKKLACIDPALTTLLE